MLRIDPATREVREVGASLEGEVRRQNKWQNGYCAADGCIFGIPLKGETVLVIRPDAAGGEPEVSTVGGPLVGLNKWEGGVVGPDGAMYCMPLNHKRVLRIAPGSSPPPIAK